MDVSTFTGESIQSALADARLELGDDVVLIESTPSTETDPARITVMVDEGGQSQPSQGRKSKGGRGRVPKPPLDLSAGDPAKSDLQNASPLSKERSSSTGAEQAGLAAGNDPEDRAQSGIGLNGDGSAPGGSQGSEAQGGTARQAGHGETGPRAAPDREKTKSKNGLSGPEDGLEGKSFRDLLAERGQSPQGTVGRGTVFPPPTGNQRGFSTSKTPASSEIGEAAGQGRGERRSAGSTDQWAAHPLFQKLMRNGMRPQTARSFFEGIASRGLDPSSMPAEQLRWAFAQVLCRRIPSPPSEEDERSGPATPIAMIGPAGAGKTTLALKLAAGESPSRNETAVVHVLPREKRLRAYQNPTPLYRQFGLAVQSVRDASEMKRALRRISSFDQVIVDTPPLPLPLSGSLPTLRRYREVLSPIDGLEFCFVLDTTRALGSISPESVRRLPVELAGTAVTHLDRADQWGRTADWMVSLGLPVRFASNGPEVPQGGRQFTTEWFVENQIGLQRTGSQ